MAIDFTTLQTHASTKPPIVMLYGPSGRGKTFLACGSANPIVLAIEDGLGSISVPHWSIASYAEVMDGLDTLATKEHNFKSVVIDSLDWLETLIWARTCKDNGWQSIEDPGYGKGYIHALRYWREMLDALRWLRDERGMTPIMISHYLIKRFDDPANEPYDRYLLKMQDRAAGLVEEAADLVGFLNYRVTIQRSKQGFGQDVARGTGGEQRILYVEGRPAFLAKNRYGMPPAIEIPKTTNPMEAWAKIAKYLPEVDYEQVTEGEQVAQGENEQKNEQKNEQETEKNPNKSTKATKTTKTTKVAA